MTKEEIPYIYSGRFDAAFLDELYADDIQTAAEIFESSLNHLITVTDEANEIFRIGEVETLRKLFHKVKPLYGYVGLLKVQARVQHFEDACSTSGSIEELKAEYDELVLLLFDSVNIVRKEMIRMKMYLNVRA